MCPKDIWVMTLTFLDHVTSSVTWLFESQYVISYWCSIGSKCLSLTDSEILCPKPHVPIGRMLNRHCACAISRDMYPYVKFKCIFQFLAPTLPIHYATFIRLRWRIRDVLSVTSIGSNVKGQIEQKFSKSKNLPNFDLLGAWRSGGMKSSDFYHKRHILAWKHVVWAILRECPLRGLTPRAEIEKSQKVSDSHRNQVSPLTRGLRYRAACSKCSHSQHARRLADVYATDLLTHIYDVIQVAPLLCQSGVAPSSGWRTHSWAVDTLL